MPSQGSVASRPGYLAGQAEPFQLQLGPNHQTYPRGGYYVNQWAAQSNNPTNGNGGNGNGHQGGVANNGDANNGKRGNTDEGQAGNSKRAKLDLGGGGEGSAS